MASARGTVEFGIFLPIANGGWIASNNAPPLDGSFDLNKHTAILAEELGFDFVLSMMKWRGFGGPRDHWGTSMESLMLMAALSQVTSRIKLWATVHTLLHHPAVAAKMMVTLDHASQGRAGLNVVSGGYRDEFSQMEKWPDTLDHDGRYDLAAEWLDAVKRLWSDKRVDFDGKFFKLTDCVCDPKPMSPPTVICAGASDAGLHMTGRHADAAFVNGKDDGELAANSKRAKAIAAEYGRTIKTFINCDVVCGATDAEAEARADHFRAGIDVDTLNGMASGYSSTPRTDGQAHTLVLRAREAFMSPYVIGSPDTVRRKLVDRIRATGIDGVMFIFPDYIADQRYFAEEVLPGIRDDLARN